MTITEMLLLNAEKYPAKPAIIHKESKISCSELCERSMALAAFLDPGDDRPGDLQEQLGSGQGRGVSASV